jgi:carboxymethylenebutenolidase
MEAPVEVVSIPGESGAIHAELARAAGRESSPGLVVVHEPYGLGRHAWGLHLSELLGRFARSGFTAIAPDLYSHVGAVDVSDPMSVQATCFDLPDAQVVRDLKSADMYLRGLPTATGKVACVGFSTGGRYALLFACSSHTPAAAVDCWGDFITHATPDHRTTAARPTPVVELISALGCPLYAAFGADDKEPSPEDAQELQSRLRQAGKNATVRVFDGAGHAFLNDKRPQRYRPRQATELWSDILAFLNAHLT